MSRLVARLAFFAFTSLLFLELVFRFILPACELPSSVQGEGGFQLFDPRYQRSGHYSSGIIPGSRSRWEINDQGWNSLFAYRAPADRTRPLIAIIGDSGIESFYSDVEEHIDTWLYEILKGRVDVYAFGRHAQPLVEMVMLLERVDSLYSPDTFILFVSHNALTASLQRNPEAEYHYLVPLPHYGTFFTVAPPAMEPSPFARTAMRSAFVRYLQLHRNVASFPLMRISSADPDLSARLRISWVKQLVPMAGQYLLADVAGTLGDRRLLIVTDDSYSRFHIYGKLDELNARSSPERDYLLLGELCEEYPNIEYLESFSAFQQDYDTAGICFESGFNRHLNGYGNYIAARSIARRLESSGTLRRILHGHEAAERLHHKMQDRSGQADP
jgi:hypothetical protein